MSLHPGPDVYPGAATFPGGRALPAVHERLRLHELDDQGQLGTDLSAPVATLGTERGGDTAGVVLEPDTGTLNVTLAGDHTEALLPGTYVTLATTDDGGHRLFTGRVRRARARTSLDNRGRFRLITTVSAADAQVELAKTKRWGAAASSVESHQARLNRLMSGMSDVSAVIDSSHPDAADIWHRSYLHETDLAGHLQILANGALLGWFVDVAGTVRLRRATVSRFGAYTEPAKRQLLLTDGSTLTDAGQATTAGWDQLPYTDLVHEFSLDDMANQVSVRRYGRRPDPDGSGDYRTDEDTYGPVANLNLTQKWGRQELTVDCAVTNQPGDERADIVLTSHYASLRTPHLRPREVTLNPGLYGYRDVELLDTIGVAHRGVLHQLYVARITHDAGPTSWTTTLTLGDGAIDTQPGYKTGGPIITDPNSGS